MLVIRKIDGDEVKHSNLLPRFLDAGYISDYQGLIDARPPGHASATSNSESHA